MMPAAPARSATPLRGVLFDFGGTLDGDGLHWLDRFYALHTELGLTSDRAQLRAAFDFAEQRAARDPGMRRAGLEEMLARHVGWQFESLRETRVELRAESVRRFVAQVRAVAAENADLLAQFRARGLRLGVLSNGCGNTQVLCEELGYAPHLSVVLDSAEAGVSKPNPDFFRQALTALGVEANAALMVGDSYERDIQPAKLLGLRTAWLTSAVAGDSECADIRLHALRELPAALATLPVS